jgi:hypothetical protein
MTSSSHVSPVDEFVDALHGTGCQLATMLAHMQTFRSMGAPAADRPAPEAILRQLLGEVLAPALAVLPDPDLRAAARALDLTATTIEAELFLVSPEPGPPRRARRRRSHH